MASLAMHAGEGREERRGKEKGVVVRGMLLRGVQGVEAGCFLARPGSQWGSGWPGRRCGLARMFSTSLAAPSWPSSINACMPACMQACAHVSQCDSHTSQSEL
eukprot:GHVU01057674.1.p1 GENE.GHVU01057674.1~~GHVU01057674.1.p1  ORF type:complete len:103 (+),score=2.48 GHVU01057674.1:648-956(+)